MVKARKKHLQQELFPAKTHGGKRKGAGRPPKGARAGSPHKKRPKLKGRFPVHVTLRVAEGIGNLRKRLMYAALREATITVAKRELAFKEEGAFRIVHVSIQRNHVHLLVEAYNAEALSRGMQSFQISAAKHVNGVISMERGERRRGNVFPDRFHEEIIKTPRHARHTLAYVLNNWRRHEEDRPNWARTWKVDPFSTGVAFWGWKEREDAERLWRWRETYKPMFVFTPTTWLLHTGWKRAGLIGFREVPGPWRGPRPKPARALKVNAARR